MFELSKDEFENLRSQIGSSSWGGTRYMPMVFTEFGIPQLSTVLNSKRAIVVNIQIIRVFTNVRRNVLNHKELLLKISSLDEKIIGHDEKIQALFNYLNQLKKSKESPRTKIGFKPNR